jgi:integrase
MSLKKVGIAKYLVTATVRDKYKGFPVSAQKTVRGTRAEAMIVYGKLLESLRKRVGSRSLKIKSISTFGDAINLYREKLEASGRGSKSHLRVLARMQCDLGHVPLGDLPDRLESYIKVLRATPARRSSPSKGTMPNTFINFARIVFNHLLELEIVDRNPIRRVRFPITKLKARNRHLTQEEQARLLAAIKDVRPEMLPLICYMLAVPSRVSELTAARREQYSDINKTVFIPTSKADIAIYKPVPPDMVDYFKTIPVDCPYLFYWKDGRSNYRPWRDISKVWDTILRKAGITDFHVHDLRHMAATTMLNAGVPKQAVMLVGGWQSDMFGVYYNQDSLVAALNIQGGDLATKSLQSRYKACQKM